MANTIKLPRLFGNYTAEGEALIMANNKLDYFNEYLNKLEHPELFEERKPKFKVGDVVVDIVEKYEKDLDLEYFIRDAILVDNGDNPPEYVYEVGLTCRPERTYKIKEDQLELDYHDVNWAEYVTESVGNRLPAWRGELYNYYVESADEELHDKDTIPVVYMEHILNDHVVYKRFGYILNNKECKEDLQRSLDLLTDYQINRFRDRLIDKLLSYDKFDTDIHQPGRLAGQSKIKFTADEKLFMYIIDKHDPKDLYPYHMTSLQIMHAIKEAYNNAHMIGRSKNKIGYNGESITYRMTIEFWFDADKNIILTAYPIEYRGIKMKKENNIEEFDEYTNNDEVKLECIKNNLSENGIPFTESTNLLDYSYYYEMAGRIPDDLKVGKNDILIVAMGANENRGEAHFHVYRNKKDLKAWKNGACLLFKDNKYFDHGNNRETLTKDELNALMECLKSKPAEGLPGRTYWEYLIYLWNSNNYNFKIAPNIPIQNYDYNTITRYKK